MKNLTKSFSNDSFIFMLLRIVLGVVFFAHGSQKTLAWFGGTGLEAGAAGFEQYLGIPAFLFYTTAFTEFLGGILLIIGLLTRPVSMGISIIMIVAIISVHFKNGFFLPGGFEYNLTLLTLSLSIFLKGADNYSLDSKIFK